MAPQWADPHHDGSATYVSDLAPDLGDTVTVFLRVPKASPVQGALLRVWIDGEQSLIEVQFDRQDERDTWPRADFVAENPVVNYRWLLGGGPAGYQWLNGEGLHNHDVTDAADFRITTHPAPPEWAADAVVYQIFPARFAKSQDHQRRPGRFRRPGTIRSSGGDPRPLCSTTAATSTGSPRILTTSPHSVPTRVLDPDLPAHGPAFGMWRCTRP
ncbi:MAG: hypothetical protein ACOYEV_03900 [Candidatus Nanopelagicales bacterium]